MNRKLILHDNNRNINNVLKQALTNYNSINMDKYGFKYQFVYN